MQALDHAICALGPSGALKLLAFSVVPFPPVGSEELKLLNLTILNPAPALHPSNLRLQVAISDVGWSIARALYFFTNGSAFLNKEP